MHKREHKLFPHAGPLKFVADNILELLLKLQPEINK